MKIRLLLFVLLGICGFFESFAMAKTDTIFIYDTVRVTIRRPAPQVFFPEVQAFSTENEKKINDSTATFFNDSINEGVNTQQTSSTMTRIKERANRFIRSIAVGSLALVATIDDAFATSEKQHIFVGIEDTIFQNVTIHEIIEVPDTINDSWNQPPMASVPIYFSFAHPVAFPLHSENYTFGFAFSLLTGSIGGLNGIQTGGLYNQLNGPGNGMQYAGLVNVSRRFRGIQVAGLCNFSNEFQGVQSGGIINISNDIKGAQVAGIMNASDNLLGIQTAGITNTAGDVQGVQISAIYNKADNLSGVQIGLINKAKNLEKGAQIGLVNIVDSLNNGFPIGLINIMKSAERYFDIEAGYNIAFRSIYFGARMGINKIYTIVDIAKSRESDDISRYELRYGIGNRMKLAEKCYLHGEFTWGILYDIDANHRLWNDIFVTRKKELSLGFAYYFSNSLNLKVTPSVFHVTDLVNFHYYTGTSHTIKEWGSRRRDYSRGGFGATLRVGISYKF